MLVSVVHQQESATRIPASPTSWASLPPPTPAHPSRSSQITSFELPGSAANSLWLPILHMVMYVFQCYSLSLSHPLLPPLCPEVCPWKDLLEIPVWPPSFSPFYLWQLTLLKIWNRRSWLGDKAHWNLVYFHPKGSHPVMIKTHKSSERPKDGKSKFSASAENRQDPPSTPLSSAHHFKAS